MTLLNVREISKACSQEPFIILPTNLWSNGKFSICNNPTMDEKISRLSQAELLYVLQTMAEFTPLTTALFNSVIEKGDDNLTEECVFAEIRQLGIWFDSSPEFGVWASTHVSEKIHRIFG